MTPNLHKLIKRSSCPIATAFRYHQWEYVQNHWKPKYAEKYKKELGEAFLSELIAIQFEVIDFVEDLAPPDLEKNPPQFGVLSILEGAAATAVELEAFEFIPMIFHAYHPYEDSSKINQSFYTYVLSCANNNFKGVKLEKVCNLLLEQADAEGVQ
jgi:hypothetical protein